MGSCNDSTQPFAKTICSICYEDLKPIAEDLQAISLCGHVFHELCIQQWFEYCSKGKKKCPICKKNCSSSDVSRLYFQSVGDSDETNLSQKPQTRKEDPDELKLEVRRLEGKIKGLNLALESRKRDFVNIIDELSVCKEQLKTETLLKNEAMEQTRTFDSLLSLKKQELKKSDMERNKLQERNTDLQKKNMDLAQELAKLKLSFDCNLEEEEISKLASLGNETCIENTVKTLTKALADRIKSYTELMAKYSTLANYEERLHEEAKKKLEKSKKNNKKLETAKEMKDNEVWRPLKASKKKKDYWNDLDGVDLTHNDTRTPEDIIKEPDVHLRETKRSRVTENIPKSNIKDGVSSYILIDDDDTPKVSVPRPTKSTTTDDDELGRYKILSDTTNEASLPVLSSREEICLSGGVLAPDGTKRHLGNFCKRGQNNKVFNASSSSKQSSGDLIAVGPDGRGGTTKVLKSTSLSSNDSRGSFPAKHSNSGSKTSGFRSQGLLQIDHFFPKAD